MTLKKGMTIFAFCVVAFSLQLMLFWTGGNALSSGAKDYKTMMFVTAGTAVMGISALVGGIVAQKLHKPHVGQKVVNYTICSYLIAALFLIF